MFSRESRNRDEVHLGSRFESAELRRRDVSFMMQLHVIVAFFNIQEVKTTLVAAENVFLLETQTHKNTLGTCFETPTVRCGPAEAQRVPTWWRMTCFW